MSDDFEYFDDSETNDEDESKSGAYRDKFCELEAIAAEPDQSRKFKMLQEWEAKYNLASDNIRRHVGIRGY